MEHGRSIRELERVSEKALEFTATLHRRLARSLDIGGVPVTVADTLPLSAVAPLLRPASAFSVMSSSRRSRRQRDS